MIANSTRLHHETLVALAAHGCTSTVLVEKPVFDHTMEPPRHEFRRVFVGYNLRFHPVIRLLRELLEHEQIFSVQAYAGQQLPDWHPAADYRASYSARAARGGGVLRDLSHELDYLSWIFGAWQRVGAVGGHLNTLEIDRDNMLALLAT